VHDLASLRIGSVQGVDLATGNVKRTTVVLSGLGTALETIGSSAPEFDAVLFVDIARIMSGAIVVVMRTVVVTISASTATGVTGRIVHVGFAERTHGMEDLSSRERSS
jgi:hypothetical protein